MQRPLGKNFLSSNFLGGLGPLAPGGYGTVSVCVFNISVQYDSLFIEAFYRYKFLIYNYNNIEYLKNFIQGFCEHNFFNGINKSLEELLINALRALILAIN